MRYVCHTLWVSVHYAVERSMVMCRAVVRVVYKCSPVSFKQGGKRSVRAPSVVFEHGRIAQTSSSPFALGDTDRMDFSSSEMLSKWPFSKLSLAESVVGVRAFDAESDASATTVFGRGASDGPSKRLG